MSLSECKLNSLLAQQNVCLAKISVCTQAGWDVPDSLSEYSEQLKREIVKVRCDLIEEGLRESQNPSIKKERND